MRLRSEPPSELLATAVARRRKGLTAAFRLAVRTGEANMKMVVVAPPRPDVGQPVPVGTRLAAQRALDRRGDEYACDPRLARERLEHAPMLRRPGRLIDIIAIRGDNIGRPHLVALGEAQTALRHRRQPAVGSFSASRPINWINTGWPQARLRDGRIICQFGPSAGSMTPPSRQPRS